MTEKIVPIDTKRKTTKEDLRKAIQRNFEKITAICTVVPILQVYYHGKEVFRIKN
jgi:hypothetical protein